MYKKILVFSFLILLNFSFFGQSSKLDSLQSIFSEIDINSNPEESLEILNLIYEYTNVTQPQLATEYVARAIFISDSILNDVEKSIYWKNKLAKIYLESNQLDQAMRYYVEVKNFYELSGDSLNYAYSLYYLGNIYLALSVPEIATQEYDKAAEIFSNFSDNYGYVMVKIQSATILYNNYDTDLAFNILFETLEFVDNDNSLKPFVLKALGVLYAEEYEVDSAEYYLLEAVKIFISNKQIIEAADIYLQLGKLYIDAEDYESAFTFLSTSSDLYFENFVSFKQAISINLIGQSYFLQEKFTEAEKYFVEALEIAIRYNNNEQKLFSYNYLSEIYLKQGNLKKSNEFLQYYIEELNNNMVNKAENGFAEVILTFQNEEKQKEIVLLENKDALKSQQLRNKQQQIYGAILIMLLLVVFSVLLYYYMKKHKNISELLQKQNAEITLQKKEIQSQSKILEKATRNLVKQKEELQNKSKKIISSIKYASRIQKAMLASDRIFIKHFSDHFILFKPKETVSGDFYWISEITEQKTSLFKSQEENIQKIVVATVDCTGHGVPGAFMSMLGDAILNQIVKVQQIYEPDKILNELHRTIRATLQQEHNENNDGMDMSMCLIDKKNRTLEFAGARNPLVYVQNDKLYRIHGDLISIGGLQREKNRVFTKHTIDITAKTYIYLYSDGFQDQFGGEFGRKYMAAPFRNFIFKNYKEDFKTQRLELVKELKRWRGRTHNQMDDITIIGFSL